MPDLLLPAMPDVLGRLEPAQQIVLALDFDGTLAPIVERPECAFLSTAMRPVLKGLASSPKVQIIILSGRALEDLRSRIDLNCVLVANHGLEIAVGGEPVVHRAASAMRPAVDCVCADLTSAFEGLADVRVENKVFTATVHYRSAPEEILGWVEATLHLVIRPYAPWLAIKPAHAAWEIRPRVDWNKGSALRFLLNRIPAPAPAVLCAGDDVADEDMFRAVPEGISVRVGAHAATAARYTVRDPAELAACLEQLAGRLARASGVPARRFWAY